FRRVLFRSRRRAISFVLTQSLTKVKTVRNLFQPPRYTPEAPFAMPPTHNPHARTEKTCIVRSVSQQDESFTGLLSKFRTAKQASGSCSWLGTDATLVVLLGTAYQKFSCKKIKAGSLQSLKCRLRNFWQ